MHSHKTEEVGPQGYVIKNKSMVQLGDHHGGISCSITNKNLNLKKLKNRIKKAV